MSDAIAAHAGSHGTHTAHHPELQHHFDTLDQQHEAATLGMWLFLITEVLFFGGLFLAYMLYRVWYPQAWAEASRELDIVLGAFNTAVLIGSSLTMALAVQMAQLGRRKALVLFLVLTILLGGTFLGIKAVEYHLRNAYGKLGIDSRRQLAGRLNPAQTAEGAAATRSP